MKSNQSNTGVDVVMSPMALARRMDILLLEMTHRSLEDIDITWPIPMPIPIILPTEKEEL